jgi:hypothetical protein
MNPIDNYGRLNVLIEAGLPIPPDLAEWWLAGVSRFESGEVKALCLGLGIRGAGIRSFKTIEFHRRKDFLLKAAANGCATYYGQSLISKCAILSEQINRYPRSKGENSMLEPLYNLYQEYGQPFEISSAGIYKAIKKTKTPRY